MKVESAVVAVLCSVLVTGCLSFLKNRPDCEKALVEVSSMVDSTIMDFGNYEVMLPPNVYCPGDYVKNIFAVPNDNSIATNDIDNSIMILKFQNGHSLAKTTVKRNFLDMVSGPFQFCFLPVWSDKEIAYSQSKGFLIINTKRKKVDIHTICPGLYSGEIGKVAVLNPEKRMFVLEILESNGNQEGDIWDDKILKVMSFDDKVFDILAEKSAGIKNDYSEPWFTYKKNVFIYKDSSTKIEVYDSLFRPVDHDLAKAFNQNGLFRRMQEIVVHESLPFAIVVERGKRPDKSEVKKIRSLKGDEKKLAVDSIFSESHRFSLYLFRWTHPDPEQRFVPLLSSAGSIWGTYNPENNYSDFSISPDGKWVVFKDKSESWYNPVYVAVPIDENNPLYLGKPIKLGKSARDEIIGFTSTTWTTNPTAFVACDGAVLYRWNLDAYHSYRKVKVPPGTPDPFMEKAE